MQPTPYHSAAPHIKTMATSTRSHSKKMSLQNSSIEEPSVGGGGTKRKSCKIDFNVMDMSVDNNNSMAKKKTKLYHPINNTVDAYSKNNSMATVAIKDRRTLSSTSLTSPTDVRRASDSLEENVGPMPSSNNNCSGQIKMLPPTLKGITDAAMVLHASKSSSTSTSQDTTTLVSFPTESVYMLACCVKSASSRSVRKLISRTDDSQTSFSSSSTSSKSDEVIIVSEASSIQEHQGGISITSSLKDIIHPSNSSLDWIVKCSSNSDSEMTSTTSSNPLLFVLDAQHALSYCHFTKPRTFAIRPPTVAKSSSATSSSVPPPTAAPSTPIVKNSSTSRNSFSPLPVYQEPSTPKLNSTTTTNGGLKCPPSTPITPGNTTNTQKKLCAANFSESREVFLRLSAKFWPGPVIFNVQVRTLQGEDSISPFENEKLMSTSTSMASLPSLLSSTGDLVAAGKTSPTPISAAALPILPESALIPAAELLPTQGGVDDRYFVSMRCPSHPLSHKILKEIYHGPSSRLNTSSPTVAPSQSTESLVSISSMDDSNGSKSNSRPRSRSIAVVGCEVPTGSSVSSSATTAADVDKVMSIKKKKDGSVLIVNGEDNREMFSVPTCQYGKSHPISLVIDGDNKTIHLIRHAKDEASPVTKDSVYRALIKPDTNNKEKKGDTSSIDRVISAVLSRWKIVESS